MERRIKRLERAVIILSVLFVLSIFTSIYSAMQIRAVASKIPSYSEIKKDIQTLNTIYKISEVKVPKAYNYTKVKVSEAYSYSKEHLVKLLSTPASEDKFVKSK
jgi:hypothetical protein